MRFGSLFSGIGGLDLGLERAGMECAWQVEIDPYARRVLEKHWPDVARFEDVRKVCGRGCNNQPDDEHLDSVDLICGGFPCQDISVAGKGKGLAGDRSGLWREYARLIDEIRPPWVLIENVPALRTRGLRTVLGDIHASGYDAEWDGLSASAVGAPHRRDRLFIIAHARGQSLRLEHGRGSGENGEGAPEFGRNGCPSDMADLDRNASNPYSPRLERPQYVGQWVGLQQIFSDVCRETSSPENGWASEPDVGRVAHGVPARVDRLRCLGNAVVPQVAEQIGRAIMKAVYP